MLVIGDDNGEIIWGITVEFREELKSAYGRILKAIYEFTYLFGLSFSSTNPPLTEHW